MNQEEPHAAPPDDAVDGSVTGPQTVARPKPVAAALIFAGVVLPFICFVISFPLNPDWQSGSSLDYAQLLLSHKCSAPLYPFLLYSMICMVVVLRRPGRFSNKFLVRLGIFFGVLVAAEYWVIFQMALPGASDQFMTQVIFSVLAVLVPWCLWRLAVILHRRGCQWMLLVVGILAGVAALFAAVFGLSEALSAAIFICLWCSTPWAFASYLFVAIGLVRGRDTSRWRFSLAQLFGLVGALAAHFAAWRLSFVLMLQEYSRLPTTSPNGCFVCTAVAQGHKSVVRSEAWQTAGGAMVRVNDQLRTLKAFELLLASVSPRMHRHCRWAYDRVGPRAAALLFHPLLADVGYFLLKPLEWCAYTCLVMAIPGQMGLVHDLYRAASDR